MKCDKNEMLKNTVNKFYHNPFLKKPTKYVHEIEVGIVKRGSRYYRKLMCENQRRRHP